MIDIRKSEKRGYHEQGRRQSYQTFSFEGYYDPRYPGFRALRALSEELIGPRYGYPSQCHRDMEILSLVLEGTLEHRDSMGGRHRLHAGEMECLCAGSGIEHLERNPSRKESAHVVQLWIRPEKKNLRPEYEKSRFILPETDSGLRLIASPDGRQGSATIHQDAYVYSGLLDPGYKLSFSMEQQRHAWVHVTEGNLAINGRRLKTGDGAGISGESTLHLSSSDRGRFLLIDLN